MIYIFDPETGQILSRVTASDSHASHYGQNVVVSDDAYSDDTHYIDIVSGVFVQIPSRPGEMHTWDWLTKQWVAPSHSQVVEKATSDAMHKRSALLEGSDWTQLPDVPLATKEDWATYRQALRDITDQPGYPLDIVWPTPPIN